MLTGLLDSTQECRRKGLPVVEHDKHAFNPDANYILTISNPKAWSENGKRKPGHKDAYVFYERITYRKLWELAQTHREKLKQHFQSGGETYLAFKPDIAGFKAYTEVARVLNLCNII